MAKTKPINVAGTVVRDSDGRYLMIQEKRADIYGLWNIPAGHQDPGETLQQAAIREAYEESGLQVKLLSSKPIYVGPTANKAHMFHAFPATIIGGSVNAPEDEVLQIQWLTFAEIKKLYEQGNLRGDSTMASIQEVENAHPRH